MAVEPLILIRDEQILSVGTELLDAQGSANVPCIIDVVDKVNDSFKTYRTELHVSYITEFKKYDTICSDDGEGTFFIPGEAFVEPGVILLAAHMRKDLEHRVTNAITYVVLEAPVGTTVMPATEDWQDYVNRYLNSKFGPIDERLDYVEEQVERIPPLEDRVTELEEHGGGGGAVNIDPTFTKLGYAADAKLTGDKFLQVESSALRYDDINKVTKVISGLTGEGPADIELDETTGFATIRSSSGGGGGGAVNIDPTFTKEGFAADAKLTGDRFTGLETSSLKYNETTKEVDVVALGNGKSLEINVNETTGYTEIKGESGIIPPDSQSIKTAVDSYLADNVTAKINELDTNLTSTMTDLGAKTSASAVTGNDAFSKINTLNNALTKLYIGTHRQVMLSLDSGTVVPYTIPEDGWYYLECANREVSGPCTAYILDSTNTYYISADTSPAGAWQRATSSLMPFKKGTTIHLRGFATAYIEFVRLS